METRGDKYLINITEGNRNKYYKLHDNGNGTFVVKYGRVGGHENEMEYPISQWDKIIHDKTTRKKEPYTDVTHLHAEQNENAVPSFADIKFPTIKSLVSTLQSFAKKSVTENYMIASEAVTQKQVEEAQAILDRLIGLKDYKTANENLIELYKIIPRKMKNVKLHLFGLNEGYGLDFTKDSFQRLVTEEQATLDVMAGQVQTNTKTKDVANKAQTTLLEAMGLEIVLIEDSDRQTILRLLGPNARQFRSAFKIINTKTQSLFDKKLGEAANKATNLFWHGSRNENWWSILDSGLMIRPSNAVSTGNMFGWGCYFADKAQKSVGYTSLSGSYWASGSSNKAYLAIFKVHTGNWLKVLHHEYWMYDITEKTLKSKGLYDSLFAQGGADLRNNEYIVYNKNQCTVQYLVEIGN